MNYTDKQIAQAKKNYHNMLVIKKAFDFNPESCGWVEAERRAEDHNQIVISILGGNVELANYWKKFFLREEVLADKKSAESKAKKSANKEASSDILAPIKSAKKLGDFGKWLNTSGNPFRKEHFSKKYTQASVNAFLLTF
jgi:hypothetical protein